MQWIDRTRLTTDTLAGTFLNLGSASTVEIAAETGFDWLLIDLEHGSGTAADLREPSCLPRVARRRPRLCASHQPIRTW